MKNPKAEAFGFLSWAVDSAARGFCGGEIDPLAVMGGAPRRYLPGAVPCL